MNWSNTSRFRRIATHLAPSTREKRPSGARIRLRGDIPRVYRCSAGVDLTWRLLLRLTWTPTEKYKGYTVNQRHCYRGEGKDEKTPAGRELAFAACERLLNNVKTQVV